MSPDSIPQLSLGSAALVIFLVCAVFVTLRGMTRMIINTVVLAASAWLGFQVWQEAPALSHDWFGKTVGAVTTGLPIATFLIALFLIRKIGKIITSPFGSDADGNPQPGSAIIRLGARLLLTLIPTSLICLVGAAFIHHTGSVAEVRSFSEQTHSQSEPAPAKFTERLKAAIEAALPESWIQVLDPMADPSRVALAKAITAKAAAPLEPVIDPRTGKPIPRAIIVDDPELQNLARTGDFGTLLRHPLLTKALADPTLQSFLKDLHL